MLAPDGCLCQSPCQLDNTRECLVFVLLQALEEHSAAKAPANAHAARAVAAPARVAGAGAGADPIEDSDEEGATAPPQAVAGALLPLAPPWRPPGMHQAECQVLCGT